MLTASTESPKLRLRVGLRPRVMEDRARPNSNKSPAVSDRAPLNESDRRRITSALSISVVSSKTQEVNGSEASAFTDNQEVRP